MYILRLVYNVHSLFVNKYLFVCVFLSILKCIHRSNANYWAIVSDQIPNGIFTVYQQQQKGFWWRNLTMLILWLLLLLLSYFFYLFIFKIIRFVCSITLYRSKFSTCRYTHTLILVRSIYLQFDCNSINNIMCLRHNYFFFYFFLYLFFSPYILLCFCFFFFHQMNFEINTIFVARGSDEFRLIFICTSIRKYT